MKKVDIIKIVINELLESDDEVSEKYVLTDNQVGDLFISFVDVEFKSYIRIGKKLMEILPNKIYVRPSFETITTISQRLRSTYIICYLK
jgi:hypothetical protein